MRDALVDVVREAWGWTGADAVEVVAINPFGHLIVREGDGGFRYLDPELHTFDRIANDRPGLERWAADEEVREIWAAARLVEQAHERLGEPAPGSCYTLAPAALVAGDYAAENMVTLPIVELIRFSAAVERQAGHLPAGATVLMKVVE